MFPKTRVRLPRMLASICLLVFTTFLVSSCGSSPDETTSERSSRLAVRVSAVRTGPAMETLRYVGTIHSRNEIKVLSRVAGKVAALPVEEGQSTRRGTPVALIAAPEMDARVTRVYAEVARAKEESAFLCQQAETDRSLLASHVISRITSDASRQKCESSLAASRAAEARLNELKVLAGNTVERAPFDGKVLKWLAEPGENAMPGRPLLIFGDETLEVRVRVHEKDVLAGIHQGTPVLLDTQGTHPVRSTVSSISPMAAGPGRTMDVRVPLDNEGRAGLWHGMSVDVAFVLKEKRQALLVPAAAVRETKTGAGVYTVRNGSAHWLEVKPYIREGEWVGVDADLQEGDRVVVGNLEAVRDGMAVYPVSVERKMP